MYIKCIVGKFSNMITNWNATIFYNISIDIDFDSTNKHDKFINTSPVDTNTLIIYLQKMHFTIQHRTYMN